MRRNGTLRSWDDNRGFGFIAPRDGGRELFVHISAFPRDGSRPTAGERLTYELSRGKDGKPTAVNVERQALEPSFRAARSRQSAGISKRPVAMLIAFVVLLCVAVYGFIANRQLAPAARLAAPEVARPESSAPEVTVGTLFQCDGRAHCSQMTSCSEAKFFLKNCPNTKMDGNNDGVPCEQQWCTGAFAK